MLGAGSVPSTPQQKLVMLEAAKRQDDAIQQDDAAWAMCFIKTINLKDQDRMKATFS